MSTYLLLFISEGAPRARILVGSRSAAERALVLLREKYSDAHGFRIVEAVAESLATVEDEFKAYRADLRG